MRFSSRFLLMSILLLMLPVARAARAQDSDPERNKRIAASLAVLEHGNEDEQATALFQLVQFSLPPAQGIPLFRAHLQRRTKTLPEARVIAYAIQGLEQYGSQAQAALPDLIRLFDETGTVEGYAANGDQLSWWPITAMAKIGPNDPNVVEALKRMVRRALNSPDQLNTLLEGTARALGQMGPSAHSAAPLLTLALNRCPRATPPIAGALSHMMPEASLSIPSLIRALEAGRAPEEVTDALGTMGPAAKSALPALHHVLTSPSPPLACKAFAAIAHIEGHPKMTLSEALVTLQQIDRSSLPATCAAFAAITLEGTRATSAVPILTQIVQDRKEIWLRRTAVETLATVGPGGNREAALVLILAVQQQDPVIALELDKAFEEFGTSAEKVTPELGALLRTKDARLRERVLMMLYPLGPKAAPAVPSLVWLLQPDAQGKRFEGGPSYILWLLGKIGPEAKVAVPILTDLLLQPDQNTTGARVFGRTELLVTLMKIGVTPRVLPAVREMLQSSHPTQVACAAHAVTLLGREAIDTIPLLLRPLQPDYKDDSMTSDFFYGYSYDTSARIESMRALAGFGPAAREALPLLRPYADAPDTVPNRPFRRIVLKAEAELTIRAIQQTKETQ